MEYVCELESVNKSFGSRVIFRDFNLAIAKNEMVCITGKSGSGKSTLLNMIGMFEKPDTGGIKLFGKGIPAINSEEGRKLMRNKIFYLFQNYALVESQTISYNLEIPLIGYKYSKKEKEKLKTDALDKVGVNTDIKEKIFHLSGGEQQRVAIARGYLREFELLLADEPTGSLDGDNRDMVISLLADMKKQGKAVLIVTHDPYVAEKCDRIIQL